MEKGRNFLYIPDPMTPASTCPNFDPVSPLSLGNSLQERGVRRLLLVIAGPEEGLTLTREGVWNPRVLVRDTLQKNSQSENTPS